MKVFYQHKRVEHHYTLRKLSAYTVIFRTKFTWIRCSEKKEFLFKGNNICSKSKVSTNPMMNATHNYVSSTSHGTTNR